MSYKTCEKCGDFFNTTSLINNKERDHWCEDFEVEFDGEVEIICCVSAEDAAEKFATEYNEDGDYALMGSDIQILVNGEKYCIGAEPDIHYTIRNLND